MTWWGKLATAEIIKHCNQNPAWIDYAVLVSAFFDCHVMQISWSQSSWAGVRCSSSQPPSECAQHVTVWFGKVCAVTIKTACNELANSSVQELGIGSAESRLNLVHSPSSTKIGHSTQSSLLLLGKYARMPEAEECSMLVYQTVCVAVRHIKIQDL